MFNSTVLEVGIGLVFIYFLFTTLCSAIHEAISAWMGIRADQLEKALGRLLGHDVQVKLYDHPLVSGMIHLTTRPAAGTGAVAAAPVKAADAPDRAKPQYISPKTFSRALVDILTGDEPPTFQAMERAVQANDTGIYKAVGALMSGLTTVAGPEVARDLRADAEKLREAKLNIENWYNDAMERLSGRYKQVSQVVILIIAAVVAVVCNIDSLAIANNLARNATLRASVVAAAEKQATAGDAPGTGTPIENITTDVQNINALDLPLGWDFSHPLADSDNDPLRKVIGLIVSAFALTLGAPFWFDVLNRLVNVRTAGSRPDTRQRTHEPPILPSTSTLTPAEQKEAAEQHATTVAAQQAMAVAAQQAAAAAQQAAAAAQQQAAAASQQHAAVAVALQQLQAAAAQQPPPPPAANQGLGPNTAQRRMTIASANPLVG